MADNKNKDGGSKSKKSSENSFYEEEDMENVSDSENFIPFNLKREREEGYFDKDGNYFEEKDEEDPWLEEIKDYKPKFKQMKNDLDVEETKKLSEEEVAQHRVKIASYMLNHERVNECLSRIGKEGSKTDLDQLLKSIDVVTNRHGDFEIYSYTKSELIKKETNDTKSIHKITGENRNEIKNDKNCFMKNKMLTAPSKIPGVTMEDKVWEYKWITNLEEKGFDKTTKGEGPVSLTELKEWMEKGSFKNMKIKLRHLKDEKWVSSDYLKELISLHSN